MFAFCVLRAFDARERQRGLKLRDPEQAHAQLREGKSMRAYRTRRQRYWV